MKIKTIGEAANKIDEIRLDLLFSDEPAIEMEDLGPSQHLFLSALAQLEQAIQQLKCVEMLAARERAGNF